MKDWKGIIALAVVTVLAVGLIWATTTLTGNRGGTGKEETDRETVSAGRTEELETDGYEEIQKAVKKISGDGTTEGYEVTVSAPGYQGTILLTAYIDGSGSRLEKLEIVEQQETENLGAKIVEDSFLDQFRGISLPVSLSRTADIRERVSWNACTQPWDVAAVQSGDGRTDETGKQTGTENQMASDGWSGLQDGVYEAQAREYSGGFRDRVTMTVSGGKVTELIWDAVDEEGNTKRTLVERGEYMMTEEGLTWSQQADALAARVISRQSLDFLNPDQTGRIDGVAGVSISVAPFLELVRQCLSEAGAVIDENPAVSDSEDESWQETTQAYGTGAQTDMETTAVQTSESAIENSSENGNENAENSRVDGISGATISSAGVVQGVNQAYEYIQDVDVSAR